MSCQPGMQADGAVDSRLVSLKTHVLNPSPRGMVLGGGAFGSSSAHGGGTLMMGSVSFVERDQRACFLALHHLGTQQVSGCLQAGKGDQTQGPVWGL